MGLHLKVFEKLKSLAKTVKREIKVWQLVLKDSRTPMIAKILIAMAVAYALLPFEIIPHFIPVL